MSQPIRNGIEAQNIADAEPVIVRRLVSEMVKRGIDTSLLCRGLGFEVTDLEEPAFRISYRQVCKVIRRALPLLCDPQLALHLGASANLVSWGFCFVGMMAASKSRAVLEFAIDFLPSTGRFLYIYGQDDGRQFSVVADARYYDPDVYAFLVDTTFASMMQVCHQVVSKTYGPVSVELTVARPTCAALYEQVFCCPVFFGRESNRMNFSLTQVPVASADSLVTRRSREFLALHQDGVNAVSELEAHVIRTIRSDPQTIPALCDIAASIHLTERTLRRRLAHTGVTFATILDHERMRRSLYLLRYGRQPLASVATEVGFADTRSLRRATMRWVGQTPTQIIETHSNFL